jgi:chromosome segregation ATPase
MMLVVGCSSSDPGRERANKTVASLQSTRTRVADARKQVDKTLASANAMQSGQGDLAKLYNQYKSDVAKLESQAAEARERAADMQARKNEYTQQWAQQSSQMTSPELKAASEARATKVKERYDGITAKAAAAKEAYEPFSKSLKELQTYLSNDLTREGVNAASQMFTKINTDGKNVNAKLDELIAELDSVAGSMSPSGPAPK